jgi:hypothetical protein
MAGGVGLSSEGSLSRSQDKTMPTKKRTIRTINIRVDARVDRALQILNAIHGEAKTQSEIIREAIIEKAERDSISKTQTK